MHSFGSVYRPLEETVIMKDWKKEIWTIPNLLSLFRLAIIPVYVYLYLNANTAADYTLAALILALSCLTDMVDGKIARKFGMTSKIGQLLDPIADKATQFCLLLCFSAEFPVLWSLSTLFIIKESFQLVAMYLAYRKGKMLKGALLSGKICTTALFVSMIGMVLFHDSINSKIVTIVTCVDGLFMLTAMIHYVITYCKSTNMIRNICETS